MGPVSRPSTSGITPARTAGPTWLSFDGQRVRQRFDNGPFLIRHNLTAHPLLALPALVALAQALPVDSVEYNAGDLLLNQNPDLTPQTGLSVRDTLQQIETSRSWMVLKNIEQAPAYRELVNECLDQIQAAIGAVSPGMCARQSFIFVSSPSALTPYHADFEYNFLLQVRGSKIVTVFDDQNRRLLSDEDRERVVCGGSRNLPFEDSFLNESRPFRLRPGDGLHVPLSAPHCVQVEGDVSISLSVTFQSQASRRLLALHRANRWLRGHGVTPRPVGASQPADWLKLIVWRVMKRLQSLARRFPLARGRDAGHSP